MLVNNEIGTIQPIKEIGELCRKNRVFFHTDASQGLGKIPIDVEDMKQHAVLETFESQPPEKRSRFF